MGMRTAKMLGLSGVCGLLVLGGMGCNKLSRDNSKVIGSVGGEKVTEKAFGETVRAILADDAKAKDLLTSEAAKGQRAQFLEQLLTQKALVRFAKAEGLDKDPKVQLAVEAAVANAYAQCLIERRVAKMEPSEAQLKALYDDLVKESTAAGQAASVPPYEQVKGQLPQLWKRKQGQQASDMLLTQLKQKYPVVISPEYRAAQAP